MQWYRKIMFLHVLSWNSVKICFILQLLLIDDILITLTQSHTQYVFQRYPFRKKQRSVCLNILWKLLKIFNYRLHIILVSRDHIIAHSNDQFDDSRLPVRTYSLLLIILTVHGLILSLESHRSSISIIQYWKYII